jgi:hypothetical protein
MPADAKFDCSFTVAVMGQMRRWLKSQEENGTIEFFGGWLDHDGHSVSFFGLNEVSGTTRAITKGREGNGEMIGEGGRGRGGMLVLTDMRSRTLLLRSIGPLSHIRLWRCCSCRGSGRARTSCRSLRSSLLEAL